MGGIYSKKEVGNRLRDIRCGMNLTQERFAEMLDISTQLYKKMESGENNISLSTLQKMKSKLNFSTDYLLFGEKEEQIKYNLIFQKIKESLVDRDKNGKEGPDIGR